MVIDKAYQSKTPEFLDRAFKLAGYADFMNTKQSAQVPGSVTIINTQKQLASEYVEGEVEEITVEEEEEDEN